MSFNKELFRDTILNLLAAGGTVGLRIDNLLLFAQRSGFPDLTERVLGEELEYLKELACVRGEPQPIAKGVIYWKLAAAGRMHLEAKGILK
jgi:hypothetical protein